MPPGLLILDFEIPDRIVELLSKLLRGGKCGIYRLLHPFLKSLFRALRQLRELILKLGDRRNDPLPLGEILLNAFGAGFIDGLERQIFLMEPVLTLVQPPPMPCQ